MITAIQDFYRNKVLREEVKQYIDTYIQQETIAMVFERKDVSHIADAKDLIDKVFSQMEVDYGIPKKNNTINEAR